MYLQVQYFRFEQVQIAALSLVGAHTLFDLIIFFFQLSSLADKRLYLRITLEMASSSVSQYLSQIEINTKKYLEYFALQNLPEPSYDAGDGLDMRKPPPNEIIAFRDAAIEAADELHHLLLGPLGLILSSPGDVGALCVHICSRLTFPAIPTT